VVPVSSRHARRNRAPSGRNHFVLFWGFGEELL